MKTKQQIIDEAVRLEEKKVVYGNGDLRSIATYHEKVGHNQAVTQQSKQIEEFTKKGREYANQASNVCRM